LNVGDIVQLILIVLLMLVGGVMLVMAAVAVLRLLTRRWRITTGRITDVRIDQFTDSNYYTVTVTYAYSVAEQDYIGHFVALDDQGTITSEEAQQITRYYRKGETLDVYYQPGKPDYPNLERDTGDTIFFTLVVVPVGVGAILLAAAWLNGLLDRMAGV
jgi:hypothetical protein